MPELKAFLAGGGEMGALIREHDWAASPLGAIQDSPQSLRPVLNFEPEGLVCRIDATLDQDAQS